MIAPNKWYIEATSENKEALDKWLKKVSVGGFKSIGISIFAVSEHPNPEDKTHQWWGDEEHLPDYGYKKNNFRTI